MSDTVAKKEYSKALVSKLQTRTATIGVIGLGYVGLPLALAYLRSGFKVVGFDIDNSKVDALREGRSYLPHIDASPLSSGLESETFRAVSDFSHASEVDAIIICVPTPLGPHREPDLSFINATVEEVLPFLRRGQVISLESSTYPGTTEEAIVAPIEKAGFTVGEDYFVVYSPEREDPGNSRFTTGAIPKVVGGTTQACREVGTALYETVTSAVVGVSSTRVAELTKLLENIYRAVNIGLVNELKTVADRMGIDIWEVIDAAATKPFGFNAFYPGPGLGGHCIPIDPFYLTWKARELGLNTRFIELAGEVNNAMPEWVVRKITDALNARGVATNGARVLVLGISYKKNVGDLRESPGVEIIELLRERGVEVDYSDPFIPSTPPMRRYDLNLHSVDLSGDRLAEYDCVLIATDHDAFDYDLIRSSAPLIVDTRGRYRTGEPHIVSA